MKKQTFTKAQEQLIRSLHTKKGRQKEQRCLVEGQKNIFMAKKYVLFSFSREHIGKKFDRLVTTDSAQSIAAVAKIPHWTSLDVQKKQVIVVLDGIQDPGNVGAILRLCVAFDASLVLVESADATNPKVIRSSAGAMFHVPWIVVNRSGAKETIQQFNRTILRLEKNRDSLEFKKSDFKKSEQFTLIAGSEGHGITLPIDGKKIHIPHNSKLDSLNVATALAIVLYSLTY